LNLPTFNLPLSPRRSTPQTTIQPRNSTIPCKILYLLANAVLPFPMFSSPSTSPANRSPRFRPLHSNGCHPEQSEGSASVFHLAARHPPLATIPFRIRTYEKCTPNFFRIRTSKTQDLKPFRIRTYEKTPGGVHPSHQVICPAPRSLRILEVPVWFWSTKLCDTIFPTPER
jgi:hypothetical protein